MPKVFLGDVVNKILGNEDRLTTNKEYFIGGEHFESGSIEINQFGLIKEHALGYQFHFPFDVGDVLFMTKNPRLKKAARSNISGICSIATFVLRTKNENILRQDFLPFVVQSDSFWDYLMKNQSGSVNPFIKWSTLEKYCFNLPDVNSQDRLSELVWTLQLQIKLLDNQLLLLNQLIKSRFIEMFDNSEKVPLIDVADVVMGQSPDSSTYNEQGIGVPFFQGKTEFTDTFVKINKYCSEPKKMAKEMDILMSVRAPVGAVNLTSQECCIGRGLAAITPKKGITDVWFLFNSLKIMEQQISDMGVGSTFAAISKGDLKKIKIPYASLKIQNQFSDFVKQVDKSKFELMQHIDNTKKLQKSIINDVFSPKEI